MKTQTARINIDEQIRGRRYRTRKTVRKHWKCLGCENDILPGDVHEFSWQADMTGSIRLCLKCADQN